ncbi:MAG: Uma2 family endonuclease [Acidobacteria bacterium]|nr:Uma2 family endonuclease [Acidobacteriota bacterium]
MAEPARRAATYEDLIRLPEHLVGEIIDGDLYASPRPTPRHTVSSSGILIGVGGAFGGRAGGPPGPGGWWILDEPELHLGADVVVPDIGGWRRERMPKIPDEAFFSLAPDWVCEVISPSTEQIDRVRKKRVYARERVSHMWIVNPIAQTLEVLRLTGAFWQEIGVFSGNDAINAEPFEAVTLEMARWWETE